MLLYMAKEIWQMRLSILLQSDYPELSCEHNVSMRDIKRRRGWVRVRMRGGDGSRGQSDEAVN